MHRIRRRQLGSYLVLALGVAAFAAFAQPGASSDKRPSTPARAPAMALKAQLPQKPNFTGRWKLNKQKSEFGKLPGVPDARTDVIAHREPELIDVVHTVFKGKPDSVTYRFRTDAQPTVSKIDRTDVHSISSWDGDVLALQSKMKMLIFESTLTDRWSLSSDGKTLMMLRHVKSPIGSGDQKLVFERQ